MRAGADAAHAGHARRVAVVSEDGIRDLLNELVDAHRPIDPKGFWRLLWTLLSQRTPGECRACGRVWPCNTYRIARYRLAKGPDAPKDTT